MTETFNILWRDVGCPIEPGTYNFAGKSIRVQQIHIDAAAGDPEAVFTVVDISPLVGERMYILGTRGVVA